mgnify:CR=1 FL=1
MENLEIKDIVDVNNIKKIKAEFNNLINNLEKSKINSIANFNFGGLFLLAHCFLIIPGLISFFWEIKYLGIYLLIPISLLLLTYFFMLKISIKFNSSLKNIKFKYIYESVKNKKLSINNINKINEFFDSLNEKNQNILNEILYDDLIEYNESNIAYSLLLKKIKTLSIKKIRKDKDIIFDFIEKEVKETSKKTKILDYIEKKINELTVSERVDVINNKLKKSENINVEQNKNVIKSI